MSIHRTIRCLSAALLAILMGSTLWAQVSVQVTPNNGANPDPVVRLANSSGNQVTFKVTNNGSVDTQYSRTCTGLVNVVSVTCTTVGLIAAGAFKIVTATFTTGQPGFGSVRLSVTSTNPTGASASGKWDETIVDPTAAVSPDGAAVVLTPSMGSSRQFTLTNTSLASTTYSLVAVCSGTGVSGCSPSPTSLELSGGAAGAVQVTFTTGPAGTTGLIELQAKVGSTVIDVGTVNVTVPPAIDAAAGINPEAVLARGQCLTISLASAAASECGDLRLVHPLPSVRTMNAWRTPTLMYASAHAIGWVSVAANVTLPAASQVPTTMSAELKVGGVPRASGSWAGNQWTPDSTRRIALGFSAPAVGLSTGVHDYVLKVTRVYPEGNEIDSTSGKLAIVDRSGSYFGAGWWLAGLEQWNPSTAVWIGGDGSVRQYVLRSGSVPPNRVWGAPTVTHPDSIRESGSEFVRQLPDSVWVFFDAQGRHVRTKNRQGHLTTFAYDGAGKLATITLPPAVSPVSYTVNYDGNGRVSAIVSPGVPASRTTTLTIDPSTGRLTGILEPDGRTVGFGYGSDHKITSRTDRRITVTDFQYDVGNRVSLATINLAPGTITRTLQQALSQGFAGASVPLTQVFTKLDGPRPVNTTAFYLNRFSAPDSIVDAVGQKVRFYRADTRFLGLVTHLIGATGHTVSATYDDRGRILTSNQPSASGQTAMTSYQWDGKWDHITKIANPEGDSVKFGVDPVTGNRLWQQDGRGDSTRTNFQYYADNQVSNVIPPSSGYHSYAYDAKGNLQSYFSAQDRRFTWTNNAIGLTTRMETPTGTCCQPGWPPYQIDSVEYSVRNEDTLHVVSLSGQSTTVKQKYDEEGNLKEVTRTFSPNPAGIGALLTSWEFDRANRPTRQTEPDASFERRWFDAAGNADSVITRRMIKISMTYDSLNRVTARTLPSLNLSLPPSAISTVPYSYNWAADNQTFQYSADGQLLRATNKDATVARILHANGAVLAETLSVKSADRLSTHAYITTYGYDRNGRRSSMTAPSQFTGGPISYAYDGRWDALTSVTDITGITFTFWYNARNELTRIVYGGGIDQTFSYDGDGRLSSDVITNTTGQTFPRYPGPKLRHLQVTSRDARDKIRSSLDSVQADQVNATYSGLGYLETSNMRQSLTVGAQGGPASYASGDTIVYDGIGNILATVFRDSVNLGGGWSASLQTGSNTYNTVGRLSSRAAGGVTSYSYDTAGNGYFEAMTFGGQVTRERAAYHGPDEKVLATDSRVSGRRIFEEYRYDALGRRVWVRSVTTCNPTNAIECVTPYVRRTIWDGQQELAEIQAPLDLANPEIPSALEEMDTGYPVLAFQPAGGSYGDPNPWYGRVVYGPGLVVDQPLTATRYDYRDLPASGAQSLTWPRFSWQVYWNYQGVASYGTLTTGAYAYPYSVGQGQTSCPAFGNQTTERCVIVQWPFAHTAYDRNRGNAQYLSWHGSLLEGKRDRSGLEYKRNRMYDAKTGRFTQEDPIGLAGGLNLYGFGAGDPVNFSDPFGLCPPESDEPCIGQQLRAHLEAKIRGAIETVGEWGHALKAGLGWLAKEAAIQGGMALVTGGSGNAIAITGRGLAHVVERHTVRGALTAGKSIFNAAEDVVSLVRSAESIAPVAQSGGRNFQRVVQAGREIGTDVATGQPTSTYTVITNARNELVTAFPGTPR